MLIGERRRTPTAESALPPSSLAGMRALHVKWHHTKKKRDGLKLSLFMRLQCGAAICRRTRSPNWRIRAPNKQGLLTITCFLSSKASSSSRLLFPLFFPIVFFSSVILFFVFVSLCARLLFVLCFFSGGVFFCFMFFCFFCSTGLS